MRRLEISHVRCETCQSVQCPEEWGRPCRDCANACFQVDLERAASGFNGENLLDALLRNAAYGGAGGELGFLLDVATDDVGGPGVYFRTRTFLPCDGVSSREIAAFLAGTLEERIRTYVAWKRREREWTLPEGHRICVRCRVAFKVYDNEWGRSGLCSRTCHRAFRKSGSP
jgi:hypothetical protein